MIDLTLQEMSRILNEQFNKNPAVSPEAHATYPHLLVENEKIFEVLNYCKNDERLQLDILEDLFGKEDDQGISISYHLYSSKNKIQVFLKTYIARVHDKQKSVYGIWNNALLCEKEVHEMFGIVFDNEDCNQSTFLPEDWQGFPLKKDYAFPDYFKGLEHRRPPVRKEHARYQ